MPSDNQALLLQVSADVSKLEKAFAKANSIVDKGSRQMENRAKGAATNLERFFGKTDAAKALDKVFDSTRFKILDSGVARVGVFGSALESLGVAGLAAAAGVGAVVGAFAGARDAAKFADDINDTANRLHVTTDALQEYRYAIRAAGGEEKGADEALEAFSVNLGKAQEGLVKSQRAFLALGFTKAQIKGFTDADTALKAVTERIQGLPTAQKDAIIDQLGLTGLKPLIEDGAGGMARLRDEAHKVGIVMDADLVKRGGELNDQFETVSKVVSVQLKSALVDLGPVLLSLLQLMADLAGKVADIVDAFKSIENKRTESLRSLRVEAQGQAVAIGLKQMSGKRLGPTELAQLAMRNKQVADIDAELASRAASSKAPPVTPTHTLVDQSHTPRAHDTTLSFNNSAQDAYDSSLKELAQAQAALASDIEARAGFERDAINADLTKKLNDLNNEEAKIKADANDHNNKAQLALIDKAKIEEQNAAAAKIELVNRKATVALIEQAAGFRDQQAQASAAILDADEKHASALADLALTAKDRTDFERAALYAAQEREKLLAANEVARAQSELDIATANKDAAAIQAAQNSLQAAQAGQVRLGQTQADQTKSFDFNNREPIQRYLDSLQDVNTQMQEMGVTAARDLASGLADAIVNAKSLGDVAKNVFRQIVASLLQQTIEKSIVGPLVGALGKAIPHHALGTDFAPGGLSLVGERGPELVNLRPGSQVLSADRTKAALGAGSSVIINFNGPVSNGREVRLSAQQAAARLARVAAGGRRGI